MNVETILRTGQISAFKLNDGLDSYNTVRIGSDLTNCSLLDCIFNAVSDEYFIGTKGTLFIDRAKYIVSFRSRMAHLLNSDVDSGKYALTWWEKINESAFPSKSIEDETYSLEYMLEELNSEEEIDERYIEIISELLDIDIYIFDSLSKSLIRDVKYFDERYKGRTSVVIYKICGIFELVGVKTNRGIQTSFNPTDSLIGDVRIGLDV